MNDSAPFLMLKKPFDEAMTWVDRQVSGVGLQILPTFNLQVARQANLACPCPHHGTDQCDCQMGILLIYGPQYQPVSLILHSFDGQTWISIVDSPQQRADPGLEATVRQALAVKAVELTDPLNGSCVS